jgi:hypothetical protein
VHIACAAHQVCGLTRTFIEGFSVVRVAGGRINGPLFVRDGIALIIFVLVVAVLVLVAGLIILDGSERRINCGGSAEDAESHACHQ